MSNSNNESEIGAKVAWLTGGYEGLLDAVQALNLQVMDLEIRLAKVENAE